MSGFNEGLITQKILVQPPKKSKKFKDLYLYLGVNNSSNSVLKSFFIYKILVHQKKYRKIHGFFFEYLKSVRPIWE